MEAYNRHKRFFAFGRSLVKPIFARRMGFSWDDLSNIKGPYLLLSNHTTDYDPILIGLATKNQLYFVASEHILHKPLAAWFLMRYLCPIIHKKGTKGVKTTVNILKTLRSGHSVCLFPEGNRSFNGITGDTGDATGKLVKNSGASLVTFRLEGGYLMQPRWGLGLRKGKTFGRLVNVYTPERLKEMSAEEVTEAVRTDLYEDAYARQKKNNQEFKCKNRAEGLESALFYCPECHKFGTLHSEKHTFYCDCGFKAEYTLTGFLKDEKGNKYTVASLDEVQKRAVEDNPEKVKFSDDVSLLHYGEDHKPDIVRSCTLSAENGCFYINQNIVPLEQLHGAAIYSRNVLVVYYGNDDHYEIRGNISFNALKYLYLYNTLKKGE